MTKKTQRYRARKKVRSVSSLALGLSLMTVLLGASRGADAQARTPTSPLDAPVAPPSEPVQPSPIARDAGGPPPSAAAPAELPELPAFAATGAQPAELDELLPAELLGEGGLQLGALITRALEVSLTARRGQARERGADAALAGARRAYVPQASVGFRYVRLSDYTPATIAMFNTPACLANLADCQANPQGYTEDFVLQQPILDQYSLNTSVALPISSWAGSSRHELRAAKLEREAAREASQAAQNDAVIEALEVYFELVRARAQERLAREAEAVAEKQAEEMQHRAESGLVMEHIAQLARSNHEAYRRLVIVAESRSAIAERALRDLLEYPEDEPIVVSFPLSSLPRAPEASREEWRERAAADNPIVRAQSLRADADRKRAYAERARMFPAFSIVFNHAYANPNSRIFPQTKEFIGTWDLIAQLSFSLDGALLADARRRQRLALAEESEINAILEERMSGRRALHEHGSLLASLTQVESQRIQAASAIAKEEEIRAREAAGLSTTLASLEAASQTLRARLDLIDAIIDAHLSSARLASAVGLLPTAPSLIEPPNPSSMHQSTGPAPRVTP